MTTFVLTSDKDERLDLFLARSCPDLSRSHAQRLVTQGFVTVDGATEAKPSYHLRPGQQVLATLPPPVPVDLAPEDIPFDVVYEDADLIVVNKPPGIPVHPAPGHPSGTLVNAILARCTDLSGIGGELRPGIVHRLDKDTSGLLMIAKNDRAHRDLARQLKEREVHKVYLALLEGHLKPTEGVVDASIGRHPHKRKQMAVVADGRAATTRYRVRRRYDGYTFVEVEPLTGRTHQIRVHLASLGHPVVGDKTYGHASQLVDRQFLHAWRLRFHLPLTGEAIELEAALPEDLQRTLIDIESSLSEER